MNANWSPGPLANLTAMPPPLCSVIRVKRRWSTSTPWGNFSDMASARCIYLDRFREFLRIACIYSRHCNVGKRAISKHGGHGAPSIFVTETKQTVVTSGSQLVKERITNKTNACTMFHLHMRTIVLCVAFYIRILLLYSWG